MALQHLRSSTADKRPTPAAMSDGQLALNTNLVSPGLFFKDSNGDSVKIGPVHVGTTAPNVTPGAGGQAGNSKGEQWLDTSSSRYVFKIWDGTAWRTEDGEFVNASGDTMTGALVMDNQQQVRFRETTANGSNFIAIQAPTSVAADRTLTLPDVTGTIVSTGDTGSVTSTMILDGTILNADVNASAAIVDTKLATIATAGKVSNSATTATNANTASAIVARDASGNFSAGTITAAVTGAASSNVLKAGDTMTGALVVPLASAATPSLTFTGDLNTGIFSPGADQVAVATNGVERLTVDTAATTSTLPVVHPLGAVGTPSITFTGDLNTGIWSPAADTVAASTAGSERLRITAAGLVGIGVSAPDTLLEIASNANAQTVSTIPTLRITNTDTAAIANDIAGSVEFFSKDASEPDVVTGYIRNIAEDAGTKYALTFGAKNTGSGAQERLRITATGLLVGTSTNTLNINNTDKQAIVLIGDDTYGGLAITGYNGDSNPTLRGPRLTLQRSRGITDGSMNKLASDDLIGQISFRGADGTDFEVAATIEAYADGEFNTSFDATDSPGRLVFATTADGASSPTEALRITNDRVIAYNQPTPTSKSAAATLTITELKTGIIQYTGAVATLTVPTGTLMEGGFSGIYTNMAFQWSVINTGAGICTVAAGTDHTVIGSGTVAIGASARFVSRQTAANTFVSYRLS